MLDEVYPRHVKVLAGGLTTYMAHLFSYAALKL
jgi:hypothetical protein